MHKPSGVNDRLASLRAGHLTVTESIRESFVRAQALQPRLKAFAHLPDALEIGKTDLLAPLAGITVAVKDLVDTADMPTAYGSPIHSGHMPGRDAWIVARLRSLGAHVLGKTVTTEFAWRHPGATVNPWNAGHTPGGSSSGSAAAVAAGIVPLAIGTQTLGSVIRPAAFCGIVGYKPTFGAIPRTGICPLAASLDHVGLFSRSVTDIAFALSLLAGHDVDDEHGQMLPSFDAASLTSNMIRPPRIGVLEGRTLGDVTAAQADLLQQIATCFNNAGAHVSKVTLPPQFADAADTAIALTAVEAAQHHRERMEAFAPFLSVPMRELLKQGSEVPAERHADLKILQSEYQELFAYWCNDKGIDALMLPPAPGEAPKGLAYTGDPCFCSPVTLLGVPAITLPAGFGSLGLPLGVQLVGRAGQDDELLKLARWCEGIINHTALNPDLSAFLSSK